MRTHILILVISAGMWLSNLGAAADWITAPSYYTHDPNSGERVQQYTPIGPFYTFPRGDFRRSGYRNTRSSIQAGGSTDHYHTVEEWGRAVRPYGEWRFPYRPNSVPYDAWGPPYVPFPGRFGFRRGFGQPGFFPGRVPVPGPVPPVGANPPGNPPAGNPPANQPGNVTGQFGPAFRAYPGYRPQPSDDGRYAPYDSNGPYGYPDLLQRQQRDPFVRPPENFNRRP